MNTPILDDSSSLLLIYCLAATPSLSDAIFLPDRGFDILRTIKIFNLGYWTQFLVLY
jgi:hypothetical protein